MFPLWVGVVTALSLAIIAIAALPQILRHPEVMLALLVLVVIAALWGAGHLIALESEDETIDALHDAIVRDSNGDLSVRDTPTLAKRGAQAPNFWFLVRDREGHSVSQGRVPLEYASIGDALDGIRPLSAAR